MLVWMIVQLSAVQDGICMLGKVHMRSTQAIGRVMSLAFNCTRR